MDNAYLRFLETRAIFLRVMQNHLVREFIKTSVLQQRAEENQKEIDAVRAAAKPT